MFDINKLTKEDRDILKTLTLEQRFVALDMLFAIAAEDSKYYTLTGPAGTGKTFLLAALVRILNNHLRTEETDAGGKASICVSAPTHKAASVIQSKIPSSVATTLHSALGLVLVHNEDKEELVAIGKGVSAKVLIVDECSMVGEELMKFIDSAVLSGRFDVAIFCGDAYQLPPVEKREQEDGEDEDKEVLCFSPSPTLSGEHTRVFALERIIRQQEGSGIIKCATEVRKATDKRERCEMKPWVWGSQDVLFREFDRAIDAYVKGAQGDPAWTHNNKFVCYTNQMVNKINRIVREQIYGARAEVDAVLPGEVLIAQRPVYKDVEVEKRTKDSNGDEIVEEITYKECVIQNNEELPVASVERSRVVLSVVFDQFGEMKFDTRPYDEQQDLGLKTYATHKPKKLFVAGYCVLDVWQCVSDTGVRFNVLDSESRHHFLNLVREAKARLKESKASKDHWDTWWVLKDLYLNVKYGYACTIHKSQGSTFENVFVSRVGMHPNMDADYYNRLIYTAITRPSSGLIMVAGGK